MDNLLAAMKPSIDGIAQAIVVDDSNFKPIILDIVYQLDKTEKLFM